MSFIKKVKIKGIRNIKGNGKWFVASVITSKKKQYFIEIPLDHLIWEGVIQKANDKEKAELWLNNPANEKYILRLMELYSDTELTFAN